MKNSVIKILLFLLIVLMLPYFLTTYFDVKAENGVYKDLKEAQIADDLNGEQSRMDIETYVKWSAAGSMPICFSLEALKAQVIISRSNTYQKLKNLKKTYPSLVFPISEIGLPYISETELEDRIGELEMRKYLPVLDEAVKTTKGQIVNTKKTIIFLPLTNKQAENAGTYENIISIYIPNAKYKMTAQEK